MFESHRNTAMSAAILCLAPLPMTSWKWIACTKKCTLWANLFLIFTGKEQINIAALWGVQIQSFKKKYFCSINFDRTQMKPANNNMGGTGWKFESGKVKNYTKNVS